MTDWKILNEILTMLGSTSGTNDKKAIIEQYKDNEDLKIIFKLAYDPYIMFNIKKEGNPNWATIVKHREYNMEDLLEDLQKLVEREVTGNNAFLLVSNITFLIPDFAKWLHRILNKDLKIGVAAKTINSVIPDLIPEFNLMLCERFKKIKKETIRFPVYVEPKKDGVRALAFLTPEGIEIKARSGLVLENYKQIEKELKDLWDSIIPQSKNAFILDGEIMDADFNATMTQVKRKTEINTDNSFFNVWDILPVESFLKEEIWKISLITRKKMLSDLLVSELKIADTPHIHMVQWDEVKSWEEIFERFDYWRTQGEEGVIVKNPESFYQYKRVRDWFKIKAQDVAGDKTDYSAEILEVYPGDKGTKFENSLGGFYCKIIDYLEDENNDQINERILFRVGSGFTNEMRDEYWAKREELVGKIIDVEAQEISKNKKGNYSLRFPTFQRFRDDR
jgi:DNA ligase-1